MPADPGSVQADTAEDTRGHRCYFIRIPLRERYFNTLEFILPAISRRPHNPYSVCQVRQRYFINLRNEDLILRDLFNLETQVELIAHEVAIKYPERERYLRNRSCESKEHVIIRTLS